MKKLIFILLLFISFGSCKSSKRTKNKKNVTSNVIENHNNEENVIIKNNATNLNSDEILNTKTENIINYARQFEGVRYQWGGTTKNGMDCSGLVYESFRAHHILLPRISRDMAKQGEKIPLKTVVEGDLLFFKTGNRRNSINHVGLVIQSNEGVIQFMHATTSKGVIVSSLSEDYWNSTFSEARRIL